MLRLRVEKALQFEALKTHDGLGNTHFANPVTNNPALENAYACFRRHAPIIIALQIAQFCHGDPLDSWSRSESGVQTRLNSVIFANGEFVPVGDNGTILISQDAVSWSNCVSGTQEALTGVAYGNNIFTAVGNQITLTSIDGLSWTNQTTNTYA